MAFKKVRAVVCGRVQGVGFRFFTQRMAQLTGVTGWVRNLPMGDVEIEAVGSEEQVKNFLTAVEKGPTMSFVTEVRKDFFDCDYNEYRGFEIVSY